MRIRILLQISDDNGAVGAAEEMAVFEKAAERPEDIGLSLAEDKALLAAVQHRTVTAQVADWSRRHRCCEACGRQRRVKDTYPVLFCTLYGDVTLRSPRLHRCSCQGNSGSATLSPLTALFADHVAPERLYLETRWAALVPEYRRRSSSRRAMAASITWSTAVVNRSWSGLPRDRPERAGSSEFNII